MTELPGTHVRVHTLAGTYDVTIGGTPVIPFIKLVKGDGFLVLTNPESYIPFHAIVKFEIVGDDQVSRLAAWTSTAPAS